MNGNSNIQVPSSSSMSSFESNNWMVRQKRQRELEELSPDARYALLSDIDGSEPLVFDEVPSLVQDKLRMLDSILQQMTSAETATFRLACQQSPNQHLTTDRSLKLRFLRAESFQPGLAAHRLTQYFDLVNKLFGSGALGKTLTMKDLSSDDMEALGSGGFQILQETDCAGRRICLHDDRFSRYCSVENMLRAIFYMIDVTSRDTDVQQKGLVSIQLHAGGDHQAGDTAVVDDNLIKQFASFIRFSAPVRFIGIYVASHSTAVLDKVTPTLDKILSRDILHRMIVHEAETNTKMTAEFCSSSLPESTLTSICTDDGQLRLDHHSHWMRMRHEDEKSVLVAAAPQQGVQPRTMLAQSVVFTTQQQLLPASHDSSGGALPYLGVFGGSNTNLQLSFLSNPAMANLSMWTLVGVHNPTVQAAAARSPSVAQPYQVNILPQIEPAPDLRPSSLPAVLYLETDSSVLSDYQSLLRKQIQVFQANAFDVECCTSRMNRVIHIGQVGLRCLHCATAAEWQKVPGSVYYPGALDMVYQVGQNLAKNHILKGCTAVPDSTRAELARLRSSRSRASAGKVYWKNAAEFIGLYEHEAMEGEGGLYFRSPVGL